MSSDEKSLFFKGLKCILLLVKCYINLEFLGLKNGKNNKFKIYIEPKLKEDAENILSNLGISPSDAITMFYKEVILKNGLPFDAKLARSHQNINILSCQELDEELEKGYKDINDGKVVQIDIAFKEINKDLGV